MKYNRRVAAPGEALSVTIVGNWPLQFSQCIPYIHELVRRKIDIHFCVTKYIMDVFPDVMALGESITDLDQMRNETQLAHRVYQITERFINALTSSWVLRHFVKARQNRISNTALSIVGRIVLGNPFPARKVLHVTKTRVPHLLCARKIQVYTFVGSWDHPQKIAAAGHRSDLVFVWNEGLSDDWKYFQGDSNIDCCFPIPFSYLLTSGGEKRKNTNKSNIKKVMYGMTTQSKHPGKLFYEECEVVQALASACDSVGLKLFVKPKPNGAIGELDHLLQYDNVEIGSYHVQSEKDNLILTEEYNQQRLRELAECDLVVNIATTFALDAALYGLPVAQLGFDTPELFPSIFAVQQNHHTKRHLLCNDDEVFNVSENTPFIEQLMEIFSETNQLYKKSTEFSLRLRKWMMPNESLEASVRRVVDRILL